MTKHAIILKRAPICSLCATTYPIVMLLREKSPKQYATLVADYGQTKHLLSFRYRTVSIGVRTDRNWRLLYAQF